MVKGKTLHKRVKLQAKYEQYQMLKNKKFNIGGDGESSSDSEEDRDLPPIDNSQYDSYTPNYVEDGMYNVDSDSEVRAISPRI